MRTQAVGPPHPRTHTHTRTRAQHKGRTNLLRSQRLLWIRLSFTVVLFIRSAFVVSGVGSRRGTEFGVPPLITLSSE